MLRFGCVVVLLIDGWLYCLVGGTYRLWFVVSGLVVGLMFV